VLTVNDRGEVERKFIDTQRIWGKHGVYSFSFEGDYPVGTIIEISRGGSWKHQYRSFYEVTPEGLKHFEDATTIAGKKAVLERLKAKSFAKPKTDNV
jgi:hypothetical protein